MTISPIIQKTVIINAPASAVWEALTQPALMQQWMYEKGIEIITNWEVGGPITIRGNLHGTLFENTGTVTEFVANKALTYTHLSSLSNLPDVPASYTVFSFHLAPVDNATSLSLSISNFPTESIYRHLAFYWNVALEILKKFTENTYVQ